jgi:hypothetical protein
MYHYFVLKFPITKVLTIISSSHEFINIILYLCLSYGTIGLRPIIHLPADAFVLLGHGVTAVCTSAFLPSSQERASSTTEEDFVM